MHYLESWNEEKGSAYLYAIVASYETDEARKKLFLDLADMANRQAAIWAKELAKSGKKVPEKFYPNLRLRMVGKLVQYFGTKRLRYILSAMKVRGMSAYSKVEPNYPYSATVINHEHRHKGANAASNLRAAVFGINDGLVSNMSLILGVAAATTDQHYVILTGIAGLLAGACSMGAGEFVSVRSQLEFYEYQIDLERSELEQYPDEEAAELSVIYQARGLPKEEANKLSQILISNPDKALDVLAREELGIDPNELGSPWGAALSSFAAFSFGAILPVLPFFFDASRWSLLISVCITGVALFAVGAILSFFTSQSAFKSGMRMLLIGAAAGGFTYAIGHLIGVSLG